MNHFLVNWTIIPLFASLIVQDAIKITHASYSLTAIYRRKCNVLKRNSLNQRWMHSVLFENKTCNEIQQCWSITHVSAQLLGQYDSPTPVFTQSTNKYKKKRAQQLLFLSFSFKCLCPFQFVISRMTPNEKKINKHSRKNRCETKCKNEI